MALEPITVNYIINSTTQYPVNQLGINYGIWHVGTGVSQTKFETYDASSLTSGIVSTMTNTQKQTQFKSNFETLAASTFNSFVSYVRTVINQQNLAAIGTGTTDAVIIASLPSYNDYIGINSYKIFIT